MCLEAPEWPPLPASLRRELDGRSVYTRPGTARYATAAQLSAEERLVAHAQTQGAPRLPGELAARRLGADARAAGGAAARARAGRARARARAAGCGWTRPPPSSTCSPRPAPSRWSSARPGPARPGCWPPRRRPGAARCSAPPPRRTPPTSSARPASGSTANTTRLLADLDSHPAGLADRGRRRLDGLPGPPGRAGRARGPQRLQAGPGRGPGAARRGRGRRRDDAARRPAGIRAAGRAGPVHRRLGTRRLAAAAPRATPPRWTTTTSTAGSAAPRPSRPWTRP